MIFFIKKRADLHNTMNSLLIVSKLSIGGSLVQNFQFLAIILFISLQLLDNLIKFLLTENELLQSEMSYDKYLLYNLPV